MSRSSLIKPRRPTRGRLYLALTLLNVFWKGYVLEYLRLVRLPPEEFVVDRRDCYAALRLAALQAAGRFPPEKDDVVKYRRYVFKTLSGAFRSELQRQAWWISDEARERLKAHWAAGTSPTADLLLPRSFSEVIEPDIHFLEHLIDDLPPDRATPPDPTFEAVLAHLQAHELHVLLARIPRRYREPMWLCYAEGVDFYTAGKELRLHVSVCHERATEGLKRLKAAVTREPGRLIPLD